MDIFLIMDFCLGSLRVRGRRSLGAAMKKEAPEPQGQSYKAMVPDTLDLAERAFWAVNALTGQLSTEYNYIPCGSAPFYVKPAYMSAPCCGCWGKILEPMVELRSVCGSAQNKQMEFKSFEAMVTYFEDGPNRRSVNPQARAMLALMALYQVDPQPQWKAVIGRMARRLAAAAIRKNDYAYYSNNRT